MRLPQHGRSLLFLGLSILFLGSGLPTLRAQASPYLALDDPRLPLLEHLIARGEVIDPSPQIRPLRLADVLAALRDARRNSHGPGARLAAELLRGWALPSTRAWWRIAPRAGVQAYSQGRRELLQPGGPGRIRPYADAAFTMGIGPVVASVRAAAENRLKDDPDYRPLSPDNDFKQLYRIIEGYFTAQWKWGGVHFGQVSRNWGPTGAFGIPIGSFAYPRTDIGLWLGAGAVHFDAILAPLRDGVTPSGDVATRWFAAHRLSVRLSDRIDVALWEAGVAARTGGNIDPAILNPFFLLTFGRQFGLGDLRNTMLGGDVTWRPSRGLVLRAQGGVDDWTFDATNPFPNRFGLALEGAGALGSTMSWRATYVLNSSLAFRTFDPNENFTDAGVGIGRPFVDNDQLTVLLGIPVRARWLVTPRIDLLRQGEGRYDAPFPDGAVADTLPTLFIGTRRDTWQLALGVHGQSGALAIAGMGGIQYVRNPGHLSGPASTHMVGRLQVTLGFHIDGRLEPDTP